MGNYEWSGELITSEEGNIDDLDNWTITAEDVFLADIGSSAYTSYDVGKGGFKGADIIQLYEAFPLLEEGKQKLQHIHSHHSMSCFYSGTDWENLEDRAVISNYFLMLIVNFSGSYCAKVAFKAKQKGTGATKLEFANNIDGFKPITLSGTDDEDVLVVMDCRILVEDNTSVPKEFEDRYNRVKDGIKEEYEKKKEERKSRYTGGGFHSYPGGGAQRELWDNDGWDEAPWDSYSKNNEDYEEINGVWVKTKNKKNKRVSEMTEEEWLKEQEEEEDALRIFQRDMLGHSGFGVVKFEIRHARAILNSILSGSFLSDDYKDCINAFKEQDKKIKSIGQLEDYMQQFQQDLQEHYEVVFAYNDSDEDYTALMAMIVEYLTPYRYNRLIQEIIEVAKDEIQMVEEETPESLKTI